MFSTYFDSLTKNSNPQSKLKFYYFGKNITVCTNSKTGIIVGTLVVFIFESPGLGGCLTNKEYFNMGV